MTDGERCLMAVTGAGNRAVALWASAGLAELSTRVFLHLIELAREAAAAHPKPARKRHVGPRPTAAVAEARQ